MSGCRALICALSRLTCYASLLGIGLPSGEQEASYSLSELFILRFVNSFGTVVVATRVYCNILSQIEYIYVIALAQATQILVGYLVGGGSTTVSTTAL
ncbi:hypothetical protein DSECCO2_642940 [anaerobic digester metagenome]